MKKFKKGFTLIELLVVVGIIGILASVIFVALNSSQNKSADAAVKANLNTIRSMSELFAANNGNSFLPSGGIAVSGTCPLAYNSSGTNMLSKDKVIVSAIIEAVKRGSDAGSCYNTSNAWAIAVGLKSDTTKSWCVDSGGMSKQVIKATAIVNNACN